MKLSPQYLNHQCHFILKDGSHENGVIHYFFHIKFPNRLFLLRTSDMQAMENETGMKPPHTNFDFLDDQTRNKYFTPIEESNIRSAVRIH